MSQSPRSLRRRYLDWVEDQIEAYKESVSRGELLQLAEEVVRELDVDREGQYQLTELLLCDAVDRYIFRMLKLPSYRSWRNSDAARAQRADAAGDGYAAGTVSR